MKLKILMKHLKEDEPFGKLLAFVSAIEFQKWWLVHAHIIIFLDVATKFSLQDPANIDKLISAQIPPVNSPHLRELVLKHMIHVPCSDNPDFKCMREGRCSRNFPKPFRSEKACWRRLLREEGGEFEIRTNKSNASGIFKMATDNSRVVPHSPDFLRKFRT